MGKHDVSRCLLRGKEGYSAVILLLDKFVTFACAECNMPVNTEHRRSTVLGGTASLAHV
jgi:hypothetical protein